MTDIIGGFACVLVLLTFSMRGMAMLRVVALLSNIAFICYAFMAGLMPVLALHAILLPINAYALWSMQFGKTNGGVVLRSKRASRQTSHRSTAPKHASVRDVG
jgi:hypothetical protein